LFGPTLTSIAWVLCGLTLLLSAIAIAIQPRAVRSILRKRGAEDAPNQAKGARTGAFLAAASVTQVPPLFAVSIYILGASVLPVGLCIATSSLAVIVLGARM